MKAAAALELAWVPSNLASRTTTTSFGGHPQALSLGRDVALTCYVVFDTGLSGSQTRGGSRAPCGEVPTTELGGDMARVSRSTATKKMEPGALVAPRKAREADWALKIARARQAREAAKEVRKGKPATFPSRMVP